jgi:hypothetical protein
MGIHLQDTGCTSVCQKEEAFIIINPVERTAHSVGSVFIRGSVPMGRRSPGALCVKWNRIQQ